MATYVMSDLHGCYDQYRKMLEKINFSDKDMLYILGDILDRGPNPIKIMLDIMERPNVCVIVGNHCVMAMECFRFLMQEITEENIEKFDSEMLGKLMSWQENGSETTLNEFHKCDRETQREIVAFISDFDVYDELTVNGKDFLLVHAGLSNFSTDKEMWEYELDELVWERPDYGKAYFPDKYVISGHTPTMMIEENPNPGYIFHANNHIVVDCGCYLPDGRLGCLRLEDMQEFYVS